MLSNGGCEGDLQINLRPQLLRESVHHIVDEPDPVEWFAFHAFHDGTTFIDLSLKFYEVFKQFLARHTCRFEHIVVGIVFVPVEMPQSKYGVPGNGVTSEKTGNSIWFSMMKS